MSDNNNIQIYDFVIKITYNDHIDILMRLTFHQTELSIYFFIFLSFYVKINVKSSSRDQNNLKIAFMKCLSYRKKKLPHILSTKVLSPDLLEKARVVEIKWFYHRKASIRLINHGTCLHTCKPSLLANLVNVGLYTVKSNK